MNRRELAHPRTQIAETLRLTFAQPSLWIPALVLLLPVSLVQIAAPTYLRTRLSPSPLFVVAGALLLVLLTQIALPAATALVHARRMRADAPDAGALLRLSARIGVRTFLGLIAGVMPGLWLQARYAFAPMRATRDDDPLTASGMPIARALLILAGLALLVSLLGQSLVAVLNESLGVVHAIGAVDNRTIFELNYPAHVVTTLVAHVTAAAALTIQAVGSSVVFEASNAGPVRETAARTVSPSRTIVLRLAQTAALLALLAGILATAYKFQQHVG